MKFLAPAVVATLIALGSPAFSVGLDAAALAASCGAGDCAAQIAEATRGMNQGQINEEMSRLAGELVAVAQQNPQDADLLARVAAALGLAAGRATGNLAADIREVAAQVAAGDLGNINTTAFARAVPAVPAVPGLPGVPAAPAIPATPAGGPNGSP
ncbi:MAG: hypothetical protein R3D78_05085 [Paracoccaceae bacterium]|jgi:hypothetical protein